MSNKDILNKLKTQADSHGVDEKQSKEEQKANPPVKAPEDKLPEAPQGNTTPEESVNDMLSQLNKTQRRGGMHVGMASSETGAQASGRAHRPNEPKLPGYYTLGWGAVRMPDRSVVKSTTLRGQFYYPFDSPAAKFLEARVGKGVTRVEE